MSAYIVSNETINCMVNGMIDNRIIGVLSAEEIGQALMDQNQASVNWRYGENEEAPKFRFTRKLPILGEAYTDEQVYGCVRCWKYQACETPDHKESRGWKWASTLEHALVEKKFPDYPWGL